MFSPNLYLLADGLRFDNTINLGNVIAALTFLALAAIAWSDLRWRVRNLETWRKENMEMWKDRDQLISNLGKIVERLEVLMERRTEDRGRGRRGDGD